MGCSVSLLAKRSGNFSEKSVCTQCPPHSFSPLFFTILIWDLASAGSPPGYSNNNYIYSVPTPLYNKHLNRMPRSWQQSKFYECLCAVRSRETITRGLNLWVGNENILRINIVVPHIVIASVDHYYYYYSLPFPSMLCLLLFQTELDRVDCAACCRALLSGLEILTIIPIPI